MTKRNPEFGGFSACFAVRTETDQKGKATPPARTETVYLTTRSLLIRFQPTPPARTETLLNRGMPIEQVFQPTPPARTETETLSEKLREVRAFQPTPPARTETQKQSYRSGGKDISTHSAREDGDSNTTQKNQQFFITFPQSNHIIPPQITANLPCTHPKPFSLCSFSGANPPVNSCLLLVRTKLFETSLPPAARSEYQRLFHFNPFTHPNMVHLCSVFISQVVKSKAVSLLINDICQYGF